ncbi:hypothetical protein H8D85_02070 [bacterium]|nr:hypothetical protein [bacterium]
MKKYTLTFNEEQLRIMEQALHAFARMQVGQLHTAMESITFWNSEVKEELNQTQKDWLDQLTLYEHNEMHGHTESGNIAWDIYQVLRHQMWLDRGSEPKNVVSSSVYRSAKEELPEISDK